MQRAALEQTAAELHEKCRTLSEELETKAKVIKRLETRIGEQQMECSMKTAKIADMQKLKVMVSVINEVLENEASQMDYEDIRSIFLVSPLVPPLMVLGAHESYCLPGRGGQAAE